MSFLVAQFSQPISESLRQKIVTAPNLDSSGRQPDVLAIKNTLFILPSKFLPIDDTVAFFDGHGVVGQRAINSVSSDKNCAEKILGLLKYCETNKQIAPDVSGVFLAAKIDTKTGQFTISTDPLSLYNLFTVQNHSIKAFSNNIYMLEALLHHEGFSATRTIFNACSEATIKMAGLTTTGIEGVSLLPPSTVVVGNARANSLDLRARAWLSDQSPDPRETILNSSRSVTNAIRAIEQTHKSDDLVYDLTGGVDTRLVLAAAQRSGVTQQSVFWKSNGENHDIDIPKILAARYGLKYAGFPQNFNGERLSPSEYARRAVFRQQGQSTVFDYELGQYRVSGVARVRGSMGELINGGVRLNTRRGVAWQLQQTLKSLKSAMPVKRAHFLSPDRNGLTNRNDDMYLPAMLMANGGYKYRNFVTDEFQVKLYDLICSSFDYMENIGVQRPFQVSAVYLSNLLRRHFGYCSQALNYVRPTYEPLANINLWAASMAYSAEERRNGLIVYDLIEELAPELLNMPIHAPWLEAGTKPFVHYKKDHMDLPVPSLATVKTVTDPIISPSVYKASSFFSEISEDFFDLALGTRNDHEIWHYLKRGYFEALRSQNLAETLTEKQSRKLLRLYYGLIWVHRQEDQAPISKVI